MVQRLASLISEWCSETGGTIEQLSALSGVPVQTVKRLKQGATDNPYFDTVASLVRAMNGSLDELAGISTPLPDPIALLPSDAAPADTAASLTLVRDILVWTTDYIKTIVREKDVAHERHLQDLAAAHEKHARTMRIALWAVVSFAVMEFAFIIGVYIYDLTHPDRCFFQLDQVQALMNNSAALGCLPIALTPALIRTGVKL